MQQNHQKQDNTLFTYIHQLQTFHPLSQLNDLEVSFTNIQLSNLTKITKNINQNILDFKGDPQFQILILQLIKTLYFLSDQINLNCQTIIQQLEYTIKKGIKTLDPTLKLIKQIIKPLALQYQYKIINSLKLEIAIKVFTQFFQNQTPVNNQMNSFFNLFAKEGIIVDDVVKFPFEKGGTFSCWFYTENTQQQAKIMTIMSKQKQGSGLEIILKNKKIYYQKLDQQSKFRLLKNKQIYLCEIPIGSSAYMSIEFETRKRFFQHQKYYVMNIFINQYTLKSIQIDIPNVNTNQNFSIQFFKGFQGKISTILLLSQPLASVIQELNNTRGLIYQNQIRNFTFIIENHLQSIFLLYTPIRANLTQNNIQIYDVFNRHLAHINKNHGSLIKNIAIKKQICNYGGISQFLSFLIIIGQCHDASCGLFNNYLCLIKAILLNKSGSQDQALQLNIFSHIRQYLNSTYMKLFNEKTVYILKQIYVSLNTKNIRQNFISKLLWGLNPAQHLQKALFDLYANLVKSLYIQDTQTAMSAFGIRDIINYMIENIEHGEDCCNVHDQNNQRTSIVQQNIYKNKLQKYFEIIQNMLLLKRSDEDLTLIVLQIIQIFTFRVSPCFSEIFLNFLQVMTSRDLKLSQQFSTQFKNIQTRLLIQSFLSNIANFQAKNLILKLFFKYYSDDYLVKQKLGAYEIAVCLKTSILQKNFKNSGLSYQQRPSVDSSQKSSQPRSTSLNDVGKWFYNGLLNQCFEPINSVDLVNTIINWTFKQKQQCNNGLLLLSDIYSYSTNQQKKKIWRQLSKRLDTSKVQAQILVWLIQALLQQILKKQDEDQEIRNLILELITQYQCQLIFNDQDIQQATLIVQSIIKTIYTCKFSKENDQIQVIAYLYIFESIVKKFSQKDSDLIQITKKSKIIIQTCYRHLAGYFMITKFDIDVQFQENSQQDYRVLELPLNILGIIYSILQKLTRGTDNSKIIELDNVQRNQIIIEQILLSKQKQQSFLCLIFVTLQTIFERLDQFILNQRKRNLDLIKKYLLFFVQLAQNSKSSKNTFQQEARTIYLNVTSFLQIKYYQYFHFKIESKKLDFIVQNKFRSNSVQMKQYILDIFMSLIQLLKFIVEVRSRQHTSFYELLNKRKKNKHKLNIIFPIIMKQIDQKIIQFYNIQDLRGNGKQKLQTHLLQRKISHASVQIQKKITKKLQNFIQSQKQQSYKIQRTSLSRYHDTEKQKFRFSSLFQQRINLLRLDSSSKQKTAKNRRSQIFQKHQRQLANIKKKIWSKSRLYEGFWTCSKFYEFSQNNEDYTYNNELRDIYTRSRSSKQTRMRLQPFIKIDVIQRQVPCLDDNQEINFIENFGGCNKNKQDVKKSQKYLKLGLQFIKKKFIDKIIRNSSQKPSQQDFYYNDVIWNHKLCLYAGDLRLTRQKLIYYFKSNNQYSHMSLFKYRLKEKLTKQWMIQNIEFVEHRKFKLRNNSLEIYFKNGRSIILTFLYESNKCFQFLDNLYKIKKLQQQVSIENFNPKPIQPFKIFQKSQLLKRWISGDISNLQYLLGINFLSGRSNNDLNQYPIFPWILNNYDSTKLSKDNQKNFRDLCKNMGSIGSEDRRDRFRKIFDTNQHLKTFIPAHQYHFGFHYSNIPIVLQYLIRTNPYTEAAKLLQGGKFDVPDRLFCSLSQSYINATRQMSDVRQLIPQFFYFPQFLLNTQDFKFGTQQKKKVVNHVQLPEGCTNAYDFIQNHRQMLESQYISDNLHKWIDLIFGYKNSGKEAQLSMNRFYYLTYQDNADIVQSQTEDKKSIQSQIAFFGKTPSQITYRSHPPKRRIRNKIINPIKSSRMKCFGEISNINRNLITNNKPFFNLKKQEIILFSYSPMTNKYTVIRRDGHGKIFQIVKKQTTNSIIQKQFFYLFDKHEFSYCLDQRGVFDTLPLVCIQSANLIIGGLWSGKILNYDIFDQKVESYTKHSETVTYIAQNQKLKIIISGSYNGELIVWEYDYRIRLNLQAKLVYHQQRVNHIQISQQLKVFVSSGDDCLVNMIDLYKYNLIRTFKLDQKIRWSITVTYPYYMILFCGKTKQKCYSINGQYLDQTSYEDLNIAPQIYKHMGFKDKVVFKIGKQILLVNLPDFQSQQKIVLRPGDEDASHIIFEKSRVLLIAGNNLICAYDPEQNEQLIDTKIMS